MLFINPFHTKYLHHFEYTVFFFVCYCAVCYHFKLCFFYLYKLFSLPHEKKRNFLSSMVSMRLKHILWWISNVLNFFHVKETKKYIYIYVYKRRREFINFFFFVYVSVCVFLIHFINLMIITFASTSSSLLKSSDGINSNRKKNKKKSSGK